jgi:hypothetical protein
MQKMIADKAFTYRSVPLCAGQEFDVDDEHVKLFTIIGFAHVPEGSLRGQSYETRVMEAREPKSRRRQAGVGGR